MPSRPRSPHAAALLGRADTLLSEALCGAVDRPAERFATAYVAAVRGAAAVLAASPPQPRRGASRSAWARLASVGPGWKVWADHFAQFSSTRAAVEAGVTSRVDGPAADALAGAVGDFLNVVESHLGGAAEPGSGRGDHPAGHPLLRAG
ncbi:SAV_6107 family HEPN domain-containing protein [Tomitella gaofuii]|uniref:SAV_6107 family HEPN domain-containing protein n=1 Tax=Tomitella gaofuii TaxID=2760083 RepID=UPI0015F90F36|nr:SAV_6107 family HEPN domain-containing protein [Tomitella gaofuii]